MSTTPITLPADKFDTTMTFVRPATLPVRVMLDALAVLPGFNTRVKDDEYKARVANIAESIQRQGFYEDKPLSVTMLPNDETVYVFDGEHRLEAARAASLDGADLAAGLPVAFAAEGASVKDLTVHLVHGNDGANLNPVELAAVVVRLKTLGLDKNEIAAEIGRTVRHVENLLVLASANQTTKRAVATGKIAAAEATKLIRKHGAKDGGDKIAEAVKIAEEKGARKATPKTMADSPAPKMKTVRIEVSLATGTAMGDVLKSMASQIRQTIKTDDDDNLVEDGKIVVAMTVLDHEAEAAAKTKAEERAAAAVKRAEEKAVKDAEREKAKVAAAAAKVEADKAKAAAAKTKAAEKAKADKAKQAAKDKAAAEKAKADAAKAKAAEAGGKTAGEGKTDGAAQKPATRRMARPATPAPAEAGSASLPPSTGAEDGNHGL